MLVISVMCHLHTHTHTHQEILGDFFSFFFFKVAVKLSNMCSDKSRPDTVNQGSKNSRRRKKKKSGSVQSWHDSSSILSLKSLFISARHKSADASSIVVTSCSRVPTGFLNETESRNYRTPPTLNCLPWAWSSLLVLLTHPIFHLYYWNLSWRSANTQSGALWSSRQSNLLSSYALFILILWFANSISILRFTHIIQNVRLYVFLQDTGALREIHFTKVGNVNLMALINDILPCEH